MKSRAAPASRLASALPNPPVDLAVSLSHQLKAALQQAETTDFSALDRALFEGFSSAQLDRFSREQLHRQLVFALAETVLSDGEGQASDWVLDAVRLFLARLATLSPETGSSGAEPLA